jgi:hypothetical protein
MNYLVFSFIDKASPTPKKLAISIPAPKTNQTIAQLTSTITTHLDKLNLGVDAKLTAILYRE